MRLIDQIALGGFELSLLAENLKPSAFMQLLPIQLLRHSQPRASMAAHLIMSSIGTLPAGVGCCRLRISEREAWRLREDARWCTLAMLVCFVVGDDTEEDACVMRRELAAAISIDRDSSLEWSSAAKVPPVGSYLPEEHGEDTATVTSSTIDAEGKVSVSGSRCSQLSDGGKIALVIGSKHVVSLSDSMAMVQLGKAAPIECDLEVNLAALVRRDALSLLSDSNEARQHIGLPAISNLAEIEATVISREAPEPAVAWCCWLRVMIHNQEPRDKLRVGTGSSAKPKAPGTGRRLDELSL